MKCSRPTCENEATTIYNKKPVCYSCWRLKRIMRSYQIRKTKAEGRDN